MHVGFAKLPSMAKYAIKKKPFFMDQLNIYAKGLN